MSKRSTHDNGFKPIKPTPFNQAVGVDHTLEKSPGISAKTLIVSVSLTTVFLSAIIVVFFLPEWVANDESAIAQETQPTTSTNNATSDQTSTSNTKSSTNSISDNQIANGQPTSTQVSPFEQAQQAALRKEAQSHLQELLTLQKTLKQNNADIWAKEQYEQAVNYTVVGDDNYGKRSFELASEAYQQALSIFTVIESEIDSTYNNKLTQGEQALDEGNTANALEAFSTAALFSDESGQAQQGLERANKLDQVFAHIEDGHSAFDNQQLDAAKHAYQLALELDADTKIAKQQLEKTNRLIAERQFNNHMSAGYLALDKQQFKTARNEFNKARKIKPNAVDPKTALQQTSHQETTIKIANTLKNANVAENKEDWKTAVKLYDQALNLENNLSEAQAGKARSLIALERFENINSILAKPQRLNDQNVHRQTQTFYEQALAIDSPGPILKKQLSELNTLLQVSATPIEIQLKSDGLTNVAVYKVGKMGAFDSKVISLRPGKYVSVGQRDGYRDVRVEFYVSAENSKHVTVIADEKI